MGRLYIVLMVNVKDFPQILNNSVLADLNYEVGGQASALEEEVEQEDTCLNKRQPKIVGSWGDGHSALEEVKGENPCLPQEPVSGDPRYPHVCWLNIHGGVVSVSIGWPVCSDNSQDINRYFVGSSANSMHTHVVRKSLVPSNA